MMRWEVMIVDGPDAGRKFQVPPDRPLLIGRGSASDTKINSAHVSRIHCHLELEGASLKLSDAGSQAGTFWKGSRIDEPKRLGHGDEFQIGPVRLRIVSDNPLDAATVHGSAVTEPAVAAANADPFGLIDTDLHGFHIKAVAAFGRSGVIYRAARQADDQLTAFKVFHLHLMNHDEQRERFIRAMRTMLPIQHPHIVRIYNAGRRGPLCWIAMEWVSGVNVKTLIERIGVANALEWEEVWRVATHVGRALEQACKLHIIHRNITPTNILRRDHDKAYLLSDLHLAKALDETDASQLTRPGAVLSELAYMAPEQLLTPDQITWKVDQYSLGCTLYALLTGRPPHLVESVSDLLRELRAAEVAPVRFRRPGVYEPFEDIVLKMLRRNPAERYDTPAELLRALKEVGRRRCLDADWNSM